MSLWSKAKSAWNKNVKPIGKKIVSNYKSVGNKLSSGFKKHSLFNKNNDIRKMFKKAKLKDILDNDLVQAGALTLSGGTLAPALMAYRGISAGADKLFGENTLLGKAVDGVKTLGSSVKGLLPEEVQQMKMKHLFDDDTTPADTILEAVTGRKSIFSGASARGRSTVRVSSRSSRSSSGGGRGVPR